MPKTYMLKLRHTGSDTKRGGVGSMIGEDVSYTLATSQDQTMFVEDEPAYVVRRLMPVETERLQAFPDNWTDITGCDADEITERVSAALGYGYDSKERKALRRRIEKWSRETPDTPRYKAMGNSMTTHVIEIIGRRIQAYDELHYDEVGLSRKSSDANP